MTNSQIDKDRHKDGVRDAMLTLAIYVDIIYFFIWHLKQHQQVVKSVYRHNNPYTQIKRTYILMLSLQPQVCCGWGLYLKSPPICSCKNWPEFLQTKDIMWK